MQRKLTFIILLLSSIAIQSNKYFTLALVPSNVKNLHTAMSLIVRNNFISEIKPLFFFTYFEKNSTSAFYEANDIIDDVLRDILEYPYKIVYNQQRQYSNVKINEVVLLDGIDSFRSFFSEIKFMGNLDYSHTLLFISTLSSVDDDSIYLVFEELYLMEITNVALVILTENGEILLLTYFPFTLEACRDFKPVIINRFLADQERWEGECYFPPKLRNFYGCSIRCCTWKEAPYLSVAKTKEGNKPLEGLEAEVLEFLASSLNISIHLKWIDPVNEEIEDMEAFLSKLISLKCDLAAGGFPYRRDFDTMMFSQTRYTLFSHIFIVTNVNNFYSTYDKLAYPFHQSVWLALGLTFAVSLLLITICGWSRYRHFLIGSANMTPQFHLCTLAVGAGMTTKKLPKRNFARFLVTCWLLLTFILRSAYQSGMYQMLRANKQWNPPQTIENVFEQKYLISTTPKYQKYSAILPHAQQVRIFNTSVFEAFAKLVETKEPTALIVPYEHYGYLSKVNTSLWQNLHLVKERLLTEQLTFYSPHHSFLVPQFNKMVSYGHFHDLVSMWRRKNILSLTTALKYGQITETQRNKNAKKSLITMNELGAIFMILIWLYVSAVAVFLIESIWHRYGNFLSDWLVRKNIIKENFLG